MDPLLPGEKEQPQPRERPAPADASGAQGAAYSRRDRLAIGLVSAAILGLVTVGVLNIAGTSFLAASPEQDRITESESQSRARAFNAAMPLELRLVAPAEVKQAIATMGLSDGEKEALLNAITASGASASQGTFTTPGTGTPDANATAAAPGQPAASAASPQRARNPAPAPRPAASTKKPLRLAWMTLWDTDAQDGDIVRLDSNGFSTTVTLSNAPVTFAVPVPEQGVINVTGMRDGGGGITIGAMSGPQRVALPIMSVGQVLGVPVVSR